MAPTEWKIPPNETARGGRTRRTIMVVSESDDRDSLHDFHIFDDNVDERAYDTEMEEDEQIGPTHLTDKRAYDAETEEDEQFGPTY